MKKSPTHSSQAVKLLADNGDFAVVGGYGVMFGGQDLYGETFTPQTDFGTFIVGNNVPVYYDHTLGDVQHSLGVVVKSRTDEKGLWVEAQIRKHQEYAEEVLRLIEQGVLGWSSGSAAHLVKYADDGVTVKQWPVVELSLTPQPAEPRTIGVQRIKSKRRAAAMNRAGMRSKRQRATRSSESDYAARIARLEAAMRNEPAPRNAGGTLTAPDRNHTAFRNYIVRGIKSDMQEDVGGEGGALVPTSYSADVVSPLTENSVLRRVGANIVQLAGSSAHRVPIMNLSGPAILTREEGDYSTDAPSLGSIEFRPFKLTRLTKISEELLDDSKVDVVNMVIAPDAGRAFAQAENELFINGTGASEPQGILHGLASAHKVTSASAGVIEYDDVIDVFYALPVSYRDRARWIVSDEASKMLRKLKDGSGRPIWEPSMQAGQPDLLLGRPAINTGYFPAVGTGKTVMVFGDFSFYWIAEFSNLAVQRLDQPYAANGQIGFRWYRRIDARATLGDAFAHLVMA